MHIPGDSRHIIGRIVDWCLRHPLGRRQWVALGLWLAILSGGMIVLGEHIARTTNTKVQRHDQERYLMLAEENRPMLWPTVTDGIRNPLFPWLVARVAHGTQAEIFAASKRLNVWCGALLAMALGLWAGCRMGWLPAVTFASISGLGVILPISTFCGAEVLYYGFFFAAWNSALGLLDRLTLPRCAIAGSLVALAYLAKPGATLLCGSLVVIALLRWMAARKETITTGWQGLRPLLGAALALAVATPLILPRAVSAWRQFGDPFQNTAANCFWGQDWETCLPQIWLLNPHEIHRIPPAKRPSAAAYFARNGWQGAWKRLRHGMAIQWDHIFLTEKKGVWITERPSRRKPVRRLFPFRGWFLLPPLMLTIGLGVAVRRRFGPTGIARSTWLQAAFVMLLTGATFGAFSWYWPISSNARFILALYIPIFGTLLCAAETLRRRMNSRWADALCAGMWSLMLGVFLAHMGIIATHPYFDELQRTF